MNPIEQIIGALHRVDGLKSFITNDLQVSEQPTDLKAHILEQNVQKTVQFYLKSADLYSPDTERLISDLRRGVERGLPKCSDLSFRIQTIVESLGWIRKNRIPREEIQIGNAPKPFFLSSLPVPLDASYASVIIDIQSTEDPGILLTLEESLKARIPTILSYRTFLSLFPQIDDQDDWQPFKNKEGTLVVLLPKGGAAAELLAHLGYEPSLEPFAWGEKDPFEGISDSDYQAKLAEGIPLLFSDAPIKKRLNYIGHGASTSKLNPTGLKRDTASGLLLGQFQKMISQCQKKGMDYFNLITCYAGGRNLIELFSHSHPGCFFSVCSLGDYLGILGSKKYRKSMLMFENRNHQKFWEGISSALQKKNPKALDFQPALEHMYGYHLSNLPVISMKNSRFFEPMNVHGRAQILSYQKMVSHELHLERNGRIPRNFRSPNRIDPIHVNEDCVLVYPQLIRAPLVIHKTSQGFPLILSKVPDHNQIFFREIVAEGGTPHAFIQESLLRDLFFVGLEAETATFRLIVVKRLQGRDPITFAPIVLKNVVVDKKPKYGSHPLVFYQKEGDARWYLWNEKEEEIPPEIAYLFFQKLKKFVITTPEAIRSSAADLLPAKQSNQVFLDAFDDLLKEASMAH